MLPNFGNFGRARSFQLVCQSVRLLHIFKLFNAASYSFEKVQVGKDQEKAQSEKDSHSKNRGGKKNQTNNQVLIP